MQPGSRLPLKSNLAIRKRHTKSRFGCRECKERKVKCDETRPSCSRCTTSKRYCSYLEQNWRTPRDAETPPSSNSRTSTPALSQTSSLPTPSARESSHAPSTSSQADRTDPSASVPPSSSSVWRYTLLHLELLGHFRDELKTILKSIGPGSGQMWDFVYQEALRTPYLMDQLLAYTAAHKSTIATEYSETYLLEATTLQTRAVSHFSHTTATGDKSLAPFAFSMLLGQHVLFDVFRVTPDLSTVLDNLVQCLELHKGIPIIASESMDIIRTLIQPPMFADELSLALVSPGAADGRECHDLLTRLRGSDACQATVEIYTDAVKILQRLFDTIHVSKGHSVIAVQQWPVRVSSEFISLFRQRRPEALVVLAYYAVLLHYSRNYWAFGDAGRFMICSITDHLGTYWSDWLVWPNEALTQS